jgi:hypothetical protein
MSHEAESSSSRSQSPESLGGEGHSPANLQVLDWGPWAWNNDLEFAERMAIKPDGLYFILQRSLANINYLGTIVV